MDKPFRLCYITITRRTKMKQPQYLSDLNIGDLLIVRTNDRRIKKNELIIFTGSEDNEYKFIRLNTGGEWNLKESKDDFYYGHWFDTVLEKIG